VNPEMLLGKLGGVKPGTIEGHKLQRWRNSGGILAEF
jgi:hypothetical protein